MMAARSALRPGAVQAEAADAERRLRRALQADPRHFGALCGLALLCLEHAAPAEGLALIDRALAERSDSSEAQHLRARLLHTLGRAGEAEDAYRQALALQPGDAAAWSNLGGLYSEQRRHRDAREAYGHALVLQPDFPEAHNNLGVALLALDQGEAALAQFDRALALRPGFADALGNRGSALISLGRLPEAETAFRTAIRLAPRSGRFYLDLAGCRRFEPGDPDLAAMQALAANPAGMAGEARIELHFALGKALADAGQAEASFRHFRQGNALKRVNLAYDEAATLATLRRAGERFGAELLAARAGVGASCEVPVFVVGMPRSGTTLVEQILASHPAIFGAGERVELHEAALAAADAGRMPASLFDRLASLPDARLRALGESYLEALRPLAPHAARIVDKMPGNFLHVGLIALALPRARIIHLRRNALDTCLSCYCTLFASDQPYAYNLQELGRYYRAYAELMEHWRAAVSPGLLLEIRYEDLVRDLEGQARRMVAHCGLEWDARCLRFHETRRTVHTASRAQVRQPLYRGAVGRARAYAAWLAPLAQALDDAAQDDTAR